ncbi:carboxylesterase family protein [Thalassotalea agarivorans]|nr:hypothetical protein [Thalassotalea agarivorans]
MKTTLLLALIMVIQGCNFADSDASLNREGYVSNVDQKPREYFVYLPKGYQQASDKTWPVLLFLHGNGERGNGLDELDFVLKHGPLYEAWIQKKDLPFIIISPQLHMYDFDKKLDYIGNRTRDEIPQRLEKGVEARPKAFATSQPIQRAQSVTSMNDVAPLLPLGWEKSERDLLSILDAVTAKYRVDTKRTYLSGLSYGGFGTWYMASKHP